MWKVSVSRLGPMPEQFGPLKYLSYPSLLPINCPPLDLMKSLNDALGGCFAQVCPPSKSIPIIQESTVELLSILLIPSGKTWMMLHAQALTPTMRRRTWSVWSSWHEPLIAPLPWRTSLGCQSGACRPPARLPALGEVKGQPPKAGARMNRLC